MSISTRKTNVKSWINTHQYNGLHYPLVSRGCFELLEHTKDVYEAAVLLAICRFHGEAYKRSTESLAAECHMDKRSAKIALENLVDRKIIARSTRKYLGGIVYSHKPLIDVTNTFIPGWVFSEFIEWPIVQINHRSQRRKHEMDALRLVIMLLMVNYDGYGNIKVMADSIKSVRRGKEISLSTMKKAAIEYLSGLVDRVGDRSRRRCVIRPMIAESAIRRANQVARTNVRRGQKIINRSYDFFSNQIRQHNDITGDCLQFESSKFMDFDEGY